MGWGELEVSYQLSVAYRPTTIPTDIEVDHTGMLVFPSELAREAEGLSCAVLVLPAVLVPRRGHG